MDPLFVFESSVAYYLLTVHHGTSFYQVEYKTSERDISSDDLTLWWISQKRHLELSKLTPKTRC